MSEKQPTQELCTNCPNRTKLSQLLGRIAGKEQLAEGCGGPVSVAHGTIETQVRQRGEPSPKKSEFNWNQMTGNADERRYSKNTWTTETTCGREPINPREGEVPFSTDRPTWTNEDGSRHAAFISGSEQAIADHRASQSIMEILDTTSDLQVAEDEGSVEHIQQAHDKISKQGFSLIAMTNRDERKG